VKNTPQGSITKIGANWFVRFWQTRNVDGVLVRKRFSRRLGPITTRGKHPPADIEAAARTEMAKIATSTLPEANRVLVTEFSESTWLRTRISI
jgi:hypothetical protein